MANIGQTIIIRTDIFNLPEDMGLMAAQVAHIHMRILQKMLLENFSKDERVIDQEEFLGADFSEWIKEPYLFVKKVPNFEALEYFSTLAMDAKLPTAIWKDTVYVRLSPTMKKAFPNTIVGVSIGPADSDAIRTVVGDLPLL